MSGLVPRDEADPVCGACLGLVHTHTHTQVPTATMAHRCCITSDPLTHISRSGGTLGINWITDWYQWLIKHQQNKIVKSIFSMVVIPTGGASWPWSVQTEKISSRTSIVWPYNKRLYHCRIYVNSYKTHICWCFNTAPTSVDKLGSHGQYLSPQPWGASGSQ